jgi:hypothetical protein
MKLLFKRGKNMPKRKGKLRKDEYVDTDLRTGEKKIKRRKESDLF